MSYKKDKLNALADIFQSETLEGNIVPIKLNQIKPAENQPRKNKLDRINELAQSIKKDGLLQPIIVTKRDDYYSIIAGERRYHAVKSLGHKEIECKILDKDPRDSYRLAIIENLQRENLNSYEEADAMMEMKRLYGYTDNELATAFNKSRSYMTEILSISSIPAQLLERAMQAGIKSKNFLIQLYQAEKKNQANEFLNAYEAGLLNTVKKAKEFNASVSKTAKKQSKKVKSSKLPSIERVEIIPDFNSKNISIHLLTKEKQILEDDFAVLLKDLRRCFKKYNIPQSSD
jgi:ParB family chromosome partitioning protein